MLERYILIRTLALKCGKNVVTFPGVRFENIQNLAIGDNVSIHQMCYINAEGGIEIGNDVSIAHRCTLLSSNHRYDDVMIPIKYQGMVLKKTILKDNIWGGCGVTILGGVVVENGCVIGSNSTITKNVSENSVMIGASAKLMKGRIASTRLLEK